MQISVNEITILSGRPQTLTTEILFTLSSRNSIYSFGYLPALHSPCVAQLNVIRTQAAVDIVYRVSSTDG